MQNQAGFSQLYNCMLDLSSLSLRVKLAQTPLKCSFSLCVLASSATCSLYICSTLAVSSYMLFPGCTIQLQTLLLLPRSFLLLYLSTWQFLLSVKTQLKHFSLKSFLQTQQACSPLYSYCPCAHVSCTVQCFLLYSPMHCSVSSDCVNT